MCVSPHNAPARPAIVLIDDFSPMGRSKSNKTAAAAVVAKIRDADTGIEIVDLAIDNKYYIETYTPRILRNSW
jgi:hypothetical protein